MRVRLQRVGLRPINNAVDVTNFVLMEYGQPLHAFDRKHLAEGRVVVRLARGESMTTLDGTEIELSDADLVIADAIAPQALAGIMGGEHSMVESDAASLLLEAAWFAPEPIRASARRHGFHTDSSHRFERGVDHEWGLEAASLRAVQLLSDLSGAKVSSRCRTDGERPAIPEIPLRPARVGQVLGMDIDPEESARILAGLEVEVDRSDSAHWSCRPPTHRPDLELEEDLIEEVMRHHGLESLPATRTMPSEVHIIAADPATELAERVIDALAEQGLHESISFAFTEPDKLAPFTELGPETYVELSNPMRVQHSVMRTHLLPGLRDSPAVNVSRHARPVRLFEVGRIYAWAKAHGPRLGAGEATRSVDDDLPAEFGRAGVLLADRGEGPSSGRAAVDVLLYALRRLGHEPQVAALVEEDRLAYLHPGVQACVTVGEGGERCVVGIAGEIHPDLAVQWDLPAQVRAHSAELRLDVLPPSRTGQHGEVPRFPSTSRDLSLDLHEGLPASSVLEHLLEAARTVSDTSEGAPHLAPGDDTRDSISLLEDWRGSGVDDGRRALLLRLHYRARGRSVTDAEVQSLHDAIVKRACETLASLDAKVRPR
jgi:phenylalanyl-tRNA synthetase beta chain